MTNTPFSELVSRWEESGLQFYRECMRITNQFSTKYILESVVQKQKKHVKYLLSAIGNVYKVDFISTELEKKLEQFLKKELVTEFDRENLNFVEVTKLAIRMATFYRDIYSDLKDNDQLKDMHEVLERIIQSKTAFINQLESERQRLSYGKP